MIVIKLFDFKEELISVHFRDVYFRTCIVFAQKLNIFRVQTARLNDSSLFIRKYLLE